MLLTKCASCAAPLGSGGKKCTRCKTRYCGPDCQKEHWERGGHEALCKKIKKAGGAEQYHANKNYKETVAVAVEDCAADTEGQTCYICQEAVHPQTGEGLVRGCACGDRAGVASGSTGIAHVSCLMEEAKALVAEARDHRIEGERMASRWERWHRCQLCGQDYHGVVLCALGWACWKTYLGRPETDWCPGAAMTLLGIGLSAALHHEDALSVREAELSLYRRVGASEETIIAAQTNLASGYANIGRYENALPLLRDVSSGFAKLKGEEDRDTLLATYNYARCLLDLGRFEEARAVFRKTILMARRALGDSNELTLKMRWIYARALYENTAAALDDLREAVTTLEDATPIARRVLGGGNPLTLDIEAALQYARDVLRAREAPPPPA